MKKALIFFILGIASIIVLFVAWNIPFYTIKTDFELSHIPSEEQPNRIDINPTYNINSIIDIKVVDQKGTVIPHQNIQYDGKDSNTESIILESVPDGTVSLIIECSLQYDRIAPSVCTVTHSIKI